MSRCKRVCSIPSRARKQAVFSGPLGGGLVGLGERQSVFAYRNFLLSIPVTGSTPSFPLEKKSLQRKLNLPENGTVSYTYNADGTLATKTDAKKPSWCALSFTEDGLWPVACSL